MAHPQTMLSNQTHVKKNCSQAHHCKYRDIHRLQSGCQTRRQHGPGTISVMNDGLLRNTRRQVDGVETKKIPIFTQRQLAKINQTISELPTWPFLVWHGILSILYALCKRWRICFWIQDQHRKRDHPPFQTLQSVWPCNVHWHRNHPLEYWMCIFPSPRFI